MDTAPKSKNPPVDRVTVHDVAKASGVSIATVSYVLNGRTDVRIPQETRDRILDKALRLGYRRHRLAAALRTGRMHTLGIICPFEQENTPATSSNTYFKDMTLAVSFAAAKAGMNAVLFVDPSMEMPNPLAVADRRVDGVVLLGMHDYQPWVKQMVATKLPCVEIGSQVGEYSVHADNYHGGYLVGAHLAGLGHRRLAHWRGFDSPSADHRLQGFLDGATAFGAQSAQISICGQITELEALLLRSDRPTALFLYNDARAAQTLQLLKKLRMRVPEDVSMVGFDNDLRAITVDPPLTTVQNPLDAVAQLAVSLIRQQLAGDSEILSPAPVPVQLIVRSSTAPPGT